MRSPASARRLALCALTFTACRSAPPAKVVTPPPASEVPAPVRRAVREANAAPLGSTWRVEQLVEHQGRSVERYRLGGGPTLILAPDEAGTAATVQVWLRDGWGAEGTGRDGRARRWAAGWPTAPLGADHPTEHWRGSARDVSGVSWTVAADDADALLAAVASTWPTRTSTPTPTALEALEQRLRRAFWDTVSSPPPAPGSDPIRDHAVWVVAGRFERAHALRIAREALARPVGPPPAPTPKRRLGPGPRVPLEVSGPARVRLALVGFSWPDPSPAIRTRVRALAHLLARGPQARLRSLVDDGAARGVAVDVAASPAGVTMEALVHLESASATVAAARVSRALEEIGEGRTTGLELERLRAELERTRRQGWARLTIRARRMADAVLVHDDLSALGALDDSARDLDEPSLRALARTISGTKPVIVMVRPR